MDTIAHTFTPIAALKNATYIAAFFSAAVWLGFEPQSIGIFIALMTLDVVFGTIRAGIVDGGRSIRSALLSRGIIAKLLLLGVPVTCALALKGVGYSPQLLAQGVVNVLILSEAYSVLGNIHSALTRTPKNEFDAVAYVLSLIKTLLDKATRSSIT